MNILTVLQAITVSASTLGPSGAPSVEPFRITQEYRVDFIESQQCRMQSPHGKVFVGEKALYVLEKRQVTVLLDEYARRYLLEYCQ